MGAKRNQHEFGAAEHPLLVPRASQKPPMLQEGNEVGTILPRGFFK